MTITPVPDEPLAYIFTKEAGDEVLIQELIIKRPHTTLIQRTADGEPKSVTIQFQS